MTDPSTPTPTPAPLRVLEFYSGIGGARLGVEQWAHGAGRRVETVAAYDMNAPANEVYLLNFRQKPRNKAIEHVKLEDVNKLKADVWLMSPPCQPFTPGGGRAGKTGDTDTRCVSFLHITKLLTSPEMRTPDYILLENVVNFGDSDACKAFIATLQTLGYTTRSIITSPDRLKRHCAEVQNTLPGATTETASVTTESAIPYNRPRFFILAAKKEVKDVASAEADTLQAALFAEESVETAAIGDFLSSRGVSLAEGDGDDMLWVEEETYSAHPSYRFDCVSRTEVGHAVSCITKSYGKNHRGSGSLMIVDGEAEGVDVDSTEPARKRLKLETTDKERSMSLRIEGSRVTEALGEGYLRLFSPAEALALHGYPRGFQFPAKNTNIHKWRVIGNSLSCDVYSALCRILFAK